MSENKKILAIYSYMDLLIDTIRELRSKGFEDIRAFSPVPSHEIEDALDKGYEPSKVKYFTLCGAILGACVGAAFTVLTSLDWPIVTSAKPIVSVPPYMIIIFECMILIGGLSTFLGLIINSRLRKNVDPIHYDDRFSNDKFGILVTFDNADFEQVEHILRDFGSEELKLDGEILKEKVVESEPLEEATEEPLTQEKPTEEKESDS
ncbi:MAG: DUF3341 domain-containing protein [Thermodesulfobacteriota bacteirum]|nr:DUF3341 domain-containing protein [Thermodesulfobacteriota bacterium]